MGNDKSNANLASATSRNLSSPGGATSKDGTVTETDINSGIKTPVEDRDGTPTPVICEEMVSTVIEDLEVPTEVAPLGKTASQDDLLTYLHEVLEECDDK